MIAEELAGKRIAITGGTGFVGTALIERLLRAVPECRLVLLVRPGKRTSVHERVRREILKNNAFDRLRRELGREAFEAMAAERVVAIAGDVGTDGLGLNDADRTTLASCDIVIHSAAAVAFDSPLDSAVEINLLGPMRIAATLNELGVSPFLVAVSTCYVAGNRRGAAPEELVSRVRSTSASTGARRSARRGACVATPKRPAACRCSWPSSATRRAANWAPPARRPSPPRPSNGGSGG